MSYPLYSQSPCTDDGPRILLNTDFSKNIFFSVFNLGGTWVETVSLKIIGKLDEDVEKRQGSNESSNYTFSQFMVKHLSFIATPCKTQYILN